MELSTTSINAKATVETRKDKEKIIGRIIALDIPIMSAITKAVQMDAR